MEKVILVNKNNRTIGIEEKIKAHQKGKLHRAFSIFIFNSKKELLLQQRSKEKYHCAELWTNTVCSHPRSNETYHQAVHRRLEEEMGFDCSLRRLFSFIYKIKFDNGLTEYEYDTVFIGEYNGELKINNREVMDYKWCSIEDIKKEIKQNPDDYTLWFKIALDKYLKIS